MADMAPALTGAAQEAPHRLKLSASTSPWKARSGLLLLNGDKGRPAREDGPRSGGRLEDGAEPGPEVAGKKPLRTVELMEIPEIAPGQRAEGVPGPRRPVLKEGMRRPQHLGPPESQEESLGPSSALNSAQWPPSCSALEASLPQDSSLCPSVSAPGPNATQERLERWKNGSGPPERRQDGTLGPPTQTAPLGNARGHLAGQDLAPKPTGRTEGLSRQPAPLDCASGAPSIELSVSQDCVPGPHVPPTPGSDSSHGPLDSQDNAPGPGVLCAVRSAQMSCRQQELGARARRLCRRLQVIQAKQVERHVRQQLSGLVEMLSERGAASLPGSPQVELDRLTCSSTARLRAAQGGFDSDATESSSGGESESEEVTESSEPERAEEEQSKAPGSNRHSEWRWAVERAAIICRWTWLQAQVSDLEFRIRQQTEIYKQIRCTKCSRLTQSVENVACQNPPTTPVCDSPGSQKSSRQVNGLINCVRSSASCNGSAEDLDPEEVLGKKPRMDTLSASPALSDSTCVAARTRPLRGHKKRSLVRSSDVSSLSRKPQKPLTMKCGCDPPTTCILCGCKTYAKTSHPNAIALNERIALMDPCYHPILSFPYDSPLHLHFEALLKEDRQFRVSNKLKILKLSQLAKKPQDAGRSMFRDDRQYKRASSPSINVSSPVTPRANPAAHQLSSLSDTPPSVSQQNSNSAALKRKRFENSYDIDNIVIPMSLVAASRVEKLQYKEILTPSWRILDSSEKDVLAADPQLEDLSDEAYLERHSANEELERSRWVSWTSAVPQRRGSRSSNKSDGRWTPQPPNSQGSSQQSASPDIRFQSLNDVPLSLSSAAAENPEPYSTVQCLSVHSRTRVLSWSEDTRSSTPEIPDDEEQIVLPWEPRSFPLMDRDFRALQNLPGTPSRGRTKPHPEVLFQTSNKPGTWTESIDSGTLPENLTPASKESPLPNSISVVRVRAHSGDKIASLEYFPPRPGNKR
ncbi:KAT8 regulatory NSL complex subunit 1-like isoform X2 [Pyxicephalus adspersus]|uniref:PEHE domain-containing protein n=1 Tax=Pyxicephalus adspersus TaxID=30357 RepID=A0AAV3AR84_PYXAD|nr:TPA: hypothetical protein GDO54_012900 [Pyxicephalus adspersus]